MTTSLKDMQIGDSVCCEAPIYENMICSDCKEPSSPIKYFCEDCKDTGIIIKDEWAEPNESYEVEIKCHCQED